MLLREMLYLYRKNEGCETKRSKGRKDPEREAAKGRRGGKTHQERKYDMDPLFVIALLLFSAIEKGKYTIFFDSSMGVHVFSW